MKTKKTEKACKEKEQNVNYTSLTIERITSVTVLLNNSQTHTLQMKDVYKNVIFKYISKIQITDCVYK